MSIKKLLFILLLSLLVLPGYAQTQYTKMPYECGFETDADTAGWVFAKRPRTTPFAIGYAARRNGKRSLYLSPDSGKTIGYTSTATGYISVAYKEFSFKQGNYDFMYDLRAASGAFDDSLMVAFIPVSSKRKPSTSSTGRDWTSEGKQYAFVDEDGISVYGTTSWKTVRGTMTIPADGNYYIAFYFREFGGLNTDKQVGVIIDNIQINHKKAPLDCAAMPTDIRAVKTSSSIDLTWKGNASSYDIRYFSTHSKHVTQVYDVKDIKGKSYSLPTKNLPEGNYTFQIRANCPGDTSLWNSVNNIFIYDPSLHCVDYISLDSPYVTCTTGNFNNPYAKVEKVDYGPSDKWSLHTIHFDGDEYDPLTGGLLKTVPEGSVASVRLCGWREEIVPSGSITYKYKVSDEAKVLLVKYAAVLQYESGHPNESQTRIVVDILDSRGRPLGTCQRSEYTAKDVDKDGNERWHRYNPRAGQTILKNPIMWSDWLTLGLNLSDYVGQELQIRLTMYACGYNYHFAYCYFAFDCTNGEIEGNSCSEVPTKFVVSEGFKYLWYKMSDPNKTPVGHDNVFIPQPGDTCSYYVDMMHPEDSSCYFTLKAYTMPIVPRSYARYRHAPVGCKNIVELIDSSGVYQLASGKPEQLTDNKITSHHWDLGDYGKFDEPSPRITVPNEGDTILAKYRTEFNGCEDVREYEIIVPPIGTVYDTVSAFFCKGESIEINGHKYDKPGSFTDTLVSRFSGCDSIVTINVDVLVADTIKQDTVICSDYFVVFFGDTLRQTGLYSHHVQSSMGCDTLVYLLNLEVNESLHLTIDRNPDICADDSTYSVPFTVTSGYVTAVSVTFDDYAQSVGFENVDSIPCANDHFTLPMPPGVKPGTYNATVLFYYQDCGNLELPFVFDVKYPSSIIAQRWNDVLAVKNADYNGGYNFVSFQWFLDDRPISGAIGSNYYEHDKLQFGKEYYVLLTREDGVAIQSCPYTPVQMPEGSYTEVTTVTFAGGSVLAKVPQNAVAEVYSMAGIKVSAQTLVGGDNQVIMPHTPGIYLLVLTYPDGRREINKVVVR